MSENISSINTNTWLQGQLSKQINKQNSSENANIIKTSVEKTVNNDLQTFQDALNDLKITDEEYFEFVDVAQNPSENLNSEEKTKATTKNINSLLNNAQDDWQGKQIISESLSGLSEEEKTNVINQYQKEYGENLVEILEYWD